MADIMGNQLLHRYTLAVAKEENSGPQVDVVTSFYRGSIDPPYREMIVTMIEHGLFDDFIAGVLQGLVYRGKNSPYFNSFNEDTHRRHKPSKYFSFFTMGDRPSLPSKS